MQVRQCNGGVVLSAAVIPTKLLTLTFMSISQWRSRIAGWCRSCTSGSASTMALTRSSSMRYTS